MEKLEKEIEKLKIHITELEEMLEGVKERNEDLLESLLKIHITELEEMLEGVKERNEDLLESLKFNK